jgi:hypothetical protein
MNIQPIKYNERFNLNILNIFILKESTKNLLKINFIEYFDCSIINFKFSELIKIFRFFYLRNFFLEDFIIYFEGFLIKKINRFQILNFYDSLIFVETIIKYFRNNEIVYEFYFLFFDYIFKKNFFHLSYFLLKKIEKEIKEKKFFINVFLKKLDIFFKQREYTIANVCINFFLVFLEKENFGKNLDQKILIEAGRISLNENKIIKAFSFYYEVFSKISSIYKIKISLIFELLAYCSMFLKNQKMNLIYKNRYCKYNNLNFIFLEILNDSIEKKKFLIVETILQEKKWYSPIKIIKFFISKKYKILLKNSIIHVMESFSRISIKNLSLIIGVSTKKLKKNLSKYILNGNIKGFLNQKYEFFFNMNNIKNFSYFSILINLIFHIERFLSKYKRKS